MITMNILRGQLLYVIAGMTYPTKAEAMREWLVIEAMRENGEIA